MRTIAIAAVLCGGLLLGGCLRLQYDRCDDEPPHPECGDAGADAAVIDAGGAVDAGSTDDAGSEDAGSPEDAGGADRDAGASDEDAGGPDGDAGASDGAVTADAG